MIACVHVWTLYAFIESYRNQPSVIEPEHRPRLALAAYNVELLDDKRIGRFAVGFHRCER